MRTEQIPSTTNVVEDKPIFHEEFEIQISEKQESEIIEFSQSEIKILNSMPQKGEMIEKLVKLLIERTVNKRLDNLKSLKNKRNINRAKTILTQYKEFMTKKLLESITSKCTQYADHSLTQA